MMKSSIQKLLLFIGLTLCQTFTLQAFQITTAGARITRSATLSTLRMASDKEEEIAKLEDQLRKLKAEAAQEEKLSPPASDVTGDAASSAGEAPEEVVQEAMFLSEGWKEVEEESSEGSGGLTNILGAVGLALFLAIFSQIPVGQDEYSKYAAVKANTERIDLGDLNRGRQSSDL